MTGPCSLCPGLTPYHRVSRVYGRNGMEPALQWTPSRHTAIVRFQPRRQLPTVAATRRSRRTSDCGLYAAANASHASMTSAYPQEGTPYGIMTGPFNSPLGVPCNHPPYGRVERCLI